MIYEIIENEVVVNTIIADEEFMLQQYPKGNYRLVPATAPDTSAE